MATLVRIISGTVLAVALIGCGKSFDAAKPADNTKIAESDAPSVTSKPKNSIEMFVGYWVSEDTPTKGIIRFGTEKDFMTGAEVTKVYGLNLEPDFAYLTSAYAENDNPEVNLNGKRFESLLLRTLEGKKRVVQIDFEFATSDSIKVILKTADKTAERHFRRTDKTPELEQEFHRTQFARADQILTQVFASYSDPTCNEEWKFSTAPLHTHMDQCFKTWLNRFGTPETLQAYLKAAIEKGSVHFIEFLISAGADVRAAVPGGLTTVRSFGGYATITAGEHGPVMTNNTPDEVIEALKRHGLE
jgi:hypothetical protein